MWGRAHKRAGNENKMKKVTKKNTAAKAAQKTIASKAESPEIVAHVKRLEKADAADAKTAKKKTEADAVEEIVNATNLTPGAALAEVKKAAAKKPVSAAKAKRPVHAGVAQFVKGAAKKTASKPSSDLRKAKTAMDKANAKANSNGAAKGATKTATMIALLERKGGATAAELLAATGWQAHSLRGFISGTLGKKMGRPAKSTVNAKGERVYSL